MADDKAGKVKHVGGKVQENVGELLGDRELKREGRLAQREGEAEQDTERARQELEEATQRESEARAQRERSGKD